VHVFVGGRIVESGGPELAQRLEAEGYDAWMPEPDPTEREGVAA
jgi:Fe-S cluster assembly ATP-binding protein